MCSKKQSLVPIKAQSGFMSDEDIRNAVLRANSGERVVLYFIRKDAHASIVPILLTDKMTFSVRDHTKRLSGYVGVPGNVWAPHMFGECAWCEGEDFGLFDNYWMAYALHIQRLKERKRE